MLAIGPALYTSARLGWRMLSALGGLETVAIEPTLCTSVMLSWGMNGDLVGTVGTRTAYFGTLATFAFRERVYIIPHTVNL